MPRNTSVTLGEHFTDFVNEKIEQGRFESASEAVRAGLRLLEEHEAKLDILRKTLEAAKAELDQVGGVDGEEFFKEILA